jgi:hypothetical protein
MLVPPAVARVDAQSVLHRADAAHRAGERDRRAALVRAADRAPQRDRAVVLGHGHLLGVMDARVALELRAEGGDDRGVGGQGAAVGEGHGERSIDSVGVSGPHALCVNGGPAPRSRRMRDDRSPGRAAR